MAETKLERQVREAIEMEEAMADELVGKGDGFTDEQRKNYFAENAKVGSPEWAARNNYEKGQIGEEGYAAVLRGDISLDEAIEWVKTGEDTPAKPKRRASANGTKKTKTKPKKEPKEKTPRKPAVAQPEGLPPAMRINADGHAKVGSNMKVMDGWRAEEADTPLFEVLSRIPTTVEVRDQKELQALVKSAGRVAKKALKQEDRASQSFGKAMERMRDKLPTLKPYVNK